MHVTTVTHTVPESETDSELIEAYIRAMDAYEAAKAGVGCRVKAFTNLLVAERMLTSHGITVAASFSGSRVTPARASG
jgi:chromosome condensin MukBEF complex kleisin-like MukF subunit